MSFIERFHCVTDFESEKALCTLKIVNYIVFPVFILA